MNNVGEKYLPIGTVVILKGAKKRLMINGFAVSPSKNLDEIYDYSGCLYPEGLVSNENALFNHNQIEKVFHLGLIDPEEKEFKESLVSALYNLKKENMSNIAISQNENAFVSNSDSNVGDNVTVTNPISFATPTTGVSDLMGQQQSQPVSQQSNEQNGLPSVNRFLTNFE